MSTRDDVTSELAAALTAAPRVHPLRVAVDGITAAGKTTFAEELAAAVRVRGRTALHLSTDDYHHVAERRHRDPDRARGYYRDAYDLESFARLVLRPLGPDGDRRFVARRHELTADTVLPDRRDTAPHDAVVVVDGSFLQSGALRGHWDVVVWMDTSFGVAEDRAAERDVELFGSPEAVRTAYRERYHPACRQYLAECDPRARADAVVANDELAHPILELRRTP